jgi:hypothetical protein
MSAYMTGRGTQSKRSILTAAHARPLLPSHLSWVSMVLLIFVESSQVINADGKGHLSSEEEPRLVGMLAGSPLQVRGYGCGVVHMTCYSAWSVLSILDFHCFYSSKWPSWSCSNARLCKNQQGFTHDVSLIHLRKSALFGWMPTEHRLVLYDALAESLPTAKIGNPFCS